MPEISVFCRQIGYMKYAFQGGGVKMDFTPEIVQVVPHNDYTVSVYFVDGKIVLYDIKPKLGKGVFKVLENMDIFLNQCKIMNDTLAWDLNGNNDVQNCIDIAPETLYDLDHVGELEMSSL